MNAVSANSGTGNVATMLRMASSLSGIRSPCAGRPATLRQVDKSAVSSGGAVDLERLQVASQAGSGPNCPRAG